MSIDEPPRAGGDASARCESSAAQDERFARIFRDVAPRVFAYARRQCEADEAQDVVSETFLVAWRRRDDLPENALPWLLVTARNTIANRRRLGARQHRLTAEIAKLEAVAGSAPGADHDVIERSTVLAALARLTQLERDAVLLVAWDGLSAPEAAEVAGCSTRAFEVRLSRARARLTREMRDTRVSTSTPPRAEPRPLTARGKAVR